MATRRTRKKTSRGRSNRSRTYRTYRKKTKKRTNRRRTNQKRTKKRTNRKYGQSGGFLGRTQSATEQALQSENARLKEMLRSSQKGDPFANMAPPSASATGGPLAGPPAQPASEGVFNRVGQFTAAVKQDRAAQKETARAAGQAAAAEKLERRQLKQAEATQLEVAKRAKIDEARRAQKAEEFRLKAQRNQDKENNRINREVDSIVQYAGKRRLLPALTAIFNPSTKTEPVAAPTQPAAVAAPAQPAAVAAPTQPAAVAALAQPVAAKTPPAAPPPPGANYKAPPRAMLPLPVAEIQSQEMIQSTPRASLFQGSDLGADLQAALSRRKAEGGEAVPVAAEPTPTLTVPDTAALPMIPNTPPPPPPVAVQPVAVQPVAVQPVAVPVKTGPPPPPPLPPPEADLLSQIASGGHGAKLRKVQSAPAQKAEDKNDILVQIRNARKDKLNKTGDQLATTRSAPAAPAAPAAKSAGSVADMMAQEMAKRRSQVAVADPDDEEDEDPDDDPWQD